MHACLDVRLITNDDIVRILTKLETDDFLESMFCCVNKYDFDFFQYLIDVLMDNGHMGCVTLIIRKIIVATDNNGLEINSEKIKSWFNRINIDWNDRTNIILLTKFPFQLFKDIVDEERIDIDWDTILDFTFVLTNPAIFEYYWNEMPFNHTIENKMILLERIFIKRHSFAVRRHRFDIYRSQWIQIIISLFRQIIQESDLDEYHSTIDKLLIYLRYADLGNDYDKEIIDELIVRNYQIDPYVSKYLNFTLLRMQTNHLHKILNMEINDDPYTVSVREKQVKILFDECRKYV